MTPEVEVRFGFAGGWAQAHGATVACDDPVRAIALALRRGGASGGPGRPTHAAVVPAGTPQVESPPCPELDWRKPGCRRAEITAYDSLGHHYVRRSLADCVPAGTQIVRLP